MKKHNTFKTVPSKTVRPIEAALHDVVGGSTGSDMLASAVAGATAGAKDGMTRDGITLYFFEPIVVTSQVK